jgi:hypothetical protein
MMRYAYWIPQDRDTYSDYIILVDFPHHHWLSERTSVIPYTCSACLFQQQANSAVDTQFKHPNTHQQHAAVTYSSGWVRWLQVSYCGFGFTEAHTIGFHEFDMKYQDNNCTYL